MGFEFGIRVLRDGDLAIAGYNDLQLNLIHGTSNDVDVPNVNLLCYRSAF